MLDALRRPLPFSLLLTGTIGGAVLVALYCLAYTALFGQAETIGESLGWAVANICPWLVAIEAGKRAPNPVAAASSIVLALLASILFGYLLHVSGGSVAFELIRRLPAIGAVAFLVAVLRSGIGRRERPTG